MITLTITIPDNSSNTIKDIATIVDNAGGNLLVHSGNEDDLSDPEFESLERGYREALLIKSGKLKALPVSDLWND